MKKALILIFIILIVFLAFTLTSSSETNKKPYIAVTNFALYEITNKITNNEIEIKKLIPFGVESHGFRPSVKTIKTMTEAKVFFYNGLNFEPWIDKKYKNSFDMSNYVVLKEGDANQHEHNHSHNEDHDPHYWLDLENIVTMTAFISRELSLQFPEKEKLFTKNADAYIKELEELKKEFEAELAFCKKREIVVNHNAFGYLASRYNFQTHALTGLSPEEQVSAKRMKEIIDLVNDENIKVIFFESFVSDKTAQSISKETGIKVQSLQPLANVTQEEAKLGYVYIMRENVKKLKSAMECR